MTQNQRLNFINERRKDVKMILNKKDLQREFLVRKLEKYYNVTPRTIQRDLLKITRRRTKKGEFIWESQKT